MAMTKNRYVRSDELIFPWDYDNSNQALAFVKTKLIENSINVNLYATIEKGSKEEKVCRYIMQNLAESPEKTWMMVSSRSLGQLYDYGHRIASLFAYSTEGAVTIYNPSDTPELMDLDPSDDEVFYLWKSMLLIIVNGTVPLSRKHRQNALGSILSHRAARNMRVLWLETHIPEKGDTSDTIFQNKISTVSTLFPGIAHHFYSSGSFLWLKAKTPSTFSCADMEG